MIFHADISVVGVKPRSFHGVILHLIVPVWYTFSPFSFVLSSWFLGKQIWINTDSDFPVLGRSAKFPANILGPFRCN